MPAGRKRKYRYFMGDFETTVYEGQTDTEVWASAVVELCTEDVKILHSIGDTFKYFRSLKSNIICYYHNLKFDGSFWLDYLLNTLKYKQASEKTDSSVNGIKWEKPYDMNNGEFQYTISSRGQWYTMRIKVDNYIIELRDSLKLLPFSVDKIGKAFNTKHRKLSMEYKGFRYAGCDISADEQKYIANDVLVVKEALEIMFEQGHKELTIGACCLKEYKSLIGDEYDHWFPDLEECAIDEKIYGSPTVDSYIRHSYRGGWCYLVPSKSGIVYTGLGTTGDVNSLYPSMMSSESGNRYPVGYPTFWKGNYIPDEATSNNRFFFIRIKTRFYIRDNMLPFVQIKGSFLYKGTEMLESSDVVDKTTGAKSAYVVDFDGTLKDTRVTLTMTMTDFKLFKEHYRTIDFEILDGCYFNTEIGIFDSYINKYKKMKLESKGAMRTLAKLFLNNLYGKMASSTDSSFKYAYIKEDGTIGFYTIQANDKKIGYIPVGSAITSYARNFTIRAAQMNYHGKDKPGFIYADTDSIHCNVPPEQIVGIKVHDKNFCCWKLESCWDKAIFTRQKTYIEHVTHENCEPLDSPYWNVKCAGMPDRCKDLFVRSMEGEKAKDEEPKEFKDFLSTKRSIIDFRYGLKVPGKLMPKRVKGGIILVDTTYEMRE